MLRILTYVLKQNCLIGMMCYAIIRSDSVDFDNEYKETVSKAMLNFTNLRKIKCRINEGSQVLGGERGEGTKTNLVSLG